ncbi:DUF294 nucleotidyltransferase-like domain-containing protein [Mesobacillus maritimus]|uniref:CBS domain-containing protein n=1 Tax=Mesobacillus maritimus TaxID=1643336 RepID=A0ABS7K5G7_9BACI|nr:DUF294 nucleotidyltransferase-like domain-containing protein [Mesobacillus maritimus]MBY0097380.1 CBS domain-containing protein [Mesobacillus maritimus]
MDPQKHKNLYEAVRLHPLFQGLEHRAAFSLVQKCEQRDFKKQEIIEPREGLLVILSGLAEVFVEEEVLEILQKGELIGFSNLAEVVGKEFQVPEIQAMVQVRAVEDIRALFIPIEVVESRWKEPGVMEYLLAQVTVRLRDVYASLAEQVKLASDFGEKTPFMLRVQDIMIERLVTVDPETTVQEVAQTMSENHTSSVLVMEKEQLAGIITERDIVSRLVAKGKSYQTTASELMTPNPRTISRFAYYYEAISEMLLNGIKHLPVKDDKKTIGIVTLSDLFRKKNASVMRRLKSIEEGDEESLGQIKEAIYELTDTLIKEKVPAFTLLEVVTTLYDRVVVRVVELAEAKVWKEEENGTADRQGKPPSFAFFQMGSSGRGEQFMLTDQDHFLVYEDTGDPIYFKRLGMEITRLFEKAGYARCPGLMMASESAWRSSVSQWQERVRQWMLTSTNENLLLAQNFFSYRFVAGDERVSRMLDVGLEELVGRSKIFLYQLAQIERVQGKIPELDQPMISLFKKSRKSIDMKKEVLFPYHHSLQILALMNGILTGTPLEKIELLQEKGVFTADFADNLKSGIEQILAIYIRLRWGGAGSILALNTLSTREKDELALSLHTLRGLQSMVFARFSS